MSEESEAYDQYEQAKSQINLALRNMMRTGRRGLGFKNQEICDDVKEILSDFFTDEEMYA